jgi:alpha-tubulin suppressor-like RCC1 family protein
MHARNLLWLLPVVSLTSCAAPTDGKRIDATPGFVVHGELPRGVDIEDVVAQIPRGGFGVVGDPSTGQLATIVSTSSSSPQVVSSHFQVTAPATCTNCVGCPATSREIEIGLTQVSGPESTPLQVQTHSSMNFLSPEHSPSSWISEWNQEVTIATAGTLGTCAAFTYYFDITECGPEDDCVECAPEDTRDISCGPNGNGTQSQICVEGAWENDGVCDDPDMIIAVDAGTFYTCALRQNGTVLCWGTGPLGVVNTSSSPTPVQVANLYDAVVISAGTYHACAVRGTGGVVCWGWNADGQLGNGSQLDSDTPVAVQTLSDAADVSAGGRHTCALEGDGTTYCWGWNGFGQLGNGQGLGPEGNYIFPTPTLVPGSYIDISAGEHHTCAIPPTGGGVDCAGQGLYGQLGNGNTSDQGTMTPVSSLSDAESVSAGYVHTCARRATSELSCWGDGEHGRLGDGEEATRVTPVDVLSIDNALDVAAGWDHTCATRQSGEVSCWGRGDFGQLGNADNSSHSTAQMVSSIDDAVMVSAGGYHNCALREAGQVVCWGYGLDGQLGDGNTQSSSTPVEVALP